MDENTIDNRNKIRHLSEYVDRLINKAVSAGMHDPEIEDEIRELNDMLKALDSQAQTFGPEMEKD